MDYSQSIRVYVRKQLFFSTRQEKKIAVPGDIDMRHVLIVEVWDLKLFFTHPLEDKKNRFSNQAAVFAIRPRMNSSSKQPQQQHQQQ